MAIAPFAELERAPEHVHTYRVTPLALWNARAAGHDAEQVVDALVRFSRYAVPQPLLVDVVDTMGRYGRLQLTNDPAHGLVLVALDRAVLEEVLRQKKIAPLLGARIDDDTGRRAPVRARPPQAGAAQDRLAGRGPGRLRRRRGAPDRPASRTAGTLRDYQRQAVDGFWAGGSGVVVLPCGAGKTLVGAAAMAQARATTLILVTNTVAGRQWKRELIAAHHPDRGRDRRVLRRAQGDPPGHDRHLPGDHPQVAGEYPHLELFDSRDWGLVIYDEVHLLPARCSG